MNKWKHFAGHVMPAIIRPLHALWNQLIGTLFVCFSLTGFVWAVRNFHRSDPPTLALAFGFSLLMGYYGFSSFWKARKISRS